MTDLNENFDEKKVSLFLLLKVFLLFLGIQLVVIPLIFWTFLGFGGFHAAEIGIRTQGWFTVLTIILNFSVLFGFLFTRDPKIINFILTRDRNFVWKREIHHFLFGILACFFCYPIVNFLGYLIGLLLNQWFAISQITQSPVKMIQMLGDDLILYIAINISVGLLIPMTEELLFRGFLQSWLKERISTFLAILVSSLLFSLFHYSGSQGLSNIQYLIALFVLSCFLGNFYERKRSLFTPIGLHLAFNGITLFLIWVS